MLIELSGAQFGLKLRDWTSVRASSIWNHKYNFRQKLNDTRFNYHFFTSIWNRPNTGLGQFKYFIDAVLSRFEIEFIYFWGGKNNKQKLQNSPYDTLCLSFSCNLVGYFKQAWKSDSMF